MAFGGGLRRNSGTELKLYLKGKRNTRVETNGKAKGLRKLLLNKDVISFSMHMIDVLLPLKRLSLFLQQECSLDAEVHAVMQDTLTALREYQDSNYKGIYSEKVHSNYFERAAFMPSRTGPHLECEVQKICLLASFVIFKKG